MTRNSLLAVAAALVSGFVGLVSACGVDDIALDHRACPCGPGYVCDTANNVCVLPGDLLDSGSSGSSGASGSGEAGAEDASPDTAPPCSGQGCACDNATPCLDATYSKCVANQCVMCTLTPDSCPLGTYCVPTNDCAPGCKADGDCATLSPTAPFCDLTRHQCVQCKSNTDCTGGKKCSPSGTCAAQCVTQGSVCPDGVTICCNSLCLDKTADIFNCGGCGIACTGAQTLCCSGSCTDPLTSVPNCGKCASPCSTVHATGESCQGGNCKWTCGSGFSHCVSGNTGCETATNTVTKCGSCNTNCNNTVANASGLSCTSNSCNYASCQAGFADCDGDPTNGCERSLTSVFHCGSCANNCNSTVLNATGITCSGTTCGYTACAAGFGDCDGNPANGCECATCGALGQVCCPPGNTCNAGFHCELPPANDGKCH